MNIAAEVELQGYTLPGLAREHLDRADGNVATAIDSLVARLREDRALLKAIIRVAIAEATRHAVEMNMRHDRESIIRSINRPVVGDTRGSVIALASVIKRSLFDFPLAGGLKLRDATRDVILENAQRYEASAKDTGHKARWLRLIGQSVPDGKVAGDVMNDARVEELYRETEE